MQASARVVETFDAPTTGAAPVGAGRPDGPPRRRRPIPQRAIEIVGIVIGIALVAAMARAHDLSNDEFWSLAAGQWMLAHHAFMGLDPFSYTESHRRWVTDEWGSELALAALFRAFGNVAYSLYAIILGGLCLITTAAYARALGARGGRVVVIVLLLAVGVAGIDGRRPGARLLPGLAPARVVAPDQGAGRPPLAAAPSRALPALGQHPRLHPAGALRAGRRVGLVAHAGAPRAADRRHEPVAPHRVARPGAAGERPRVMHHALRPGTAWPTTPRSPATARSRGTSANGTHRTSIRW